LLLLPLLPPHFLCKRACRSERSRSRYSFAMLLLLPLLFALVAARMWVVVVVVVGGAAVCDVGVGRGTASATRVPYRRQ
jgi:hypothetical protein